MALAAALAYADLGVPATVGVMVAGWVLATLFVRAELRTVPHFGAGLPPRWHAAAVSLPPAQPLEQLPAGYPTARRDEAPTWIAPADLFDAWPVAHATEELQDTQPDAFPRLARHRLDPFADDGLAITVPVEPSRRPRPRWVEEGEDA